MENNSEIVQLYLDDIIPNRFQPREVFDDQALKELAVSIKEHGVIQPIIVRQVENKYEIIAGERRYKASTMAGLTKIPAIVKNLDDKESSKVALIENLQRKDLTPIEEARTYQKILELEGAMTQEELAATMGKTQSSVSNKLRLLALPEEIQDALLKEKISERHARSLLNINDKNEQIKMVERIIAEKMTVRELDRIIKEMNEGTQSGGAAPVQAPAPTPEVAPPAPVSETAEVTSSNVTVENNSLSASDLLNEDSTKTGNIFSAFRKIKERIDAEKNAMNAEANGEQPAPAQPEAKVVPTFGMNFMNNNNAESNVSVGENNTFSQESTPTVTENNNVASTVDQVGMVINSEPKNVKSAVDNIKSTIDTLKNSGYNISLNEIEGEGDYQITISIKKDA